MKVLAQLVKEEKNEIQNIFERLNSLNALVATLADAQLNIDEQNWIYEKLINDTTETRIKYNQWWTIMCDKYNLDKENSRNYYVDFVADRIILNE